MTQKPSSARSLFQFSLRHMLVAMLGVAILLGIWSTFVQPYRNQAMALRELRRLGGSIDEQAARGPDWHRWLVETMVGKGAFAHAVSLDLSDANVDDEGFVLIRSLHSLEHLIADRSRVDDQTLKAVVACPRLRKLSLRYTDLDDETMQALSALTELEELYLTGTIVSDKGLNTIGGLPNLRAVYVRWTDVTQAGADSLVKRIPECRVHF